MARLLGLVVAVAGWNYRGWNSLILRCSAPGCLGSIFSNMDAEIQIVGGSEPHMAAIDKKRHAWEYAENKWLHITIFEPAAYPAS